ncbi:MAG: hypothetical protein H0V15_02470 [Solirubrobacterales bacterium]|nr:hypothetical protein [Solirubrobacterales bacterium]
MNGIGDWPELDSDRIFTILNSHEVDYLVVGAMARVLLGSARLTKDLDVCHSPDRKNLKRLAAALDELNARPRGEDPGHQIALDDVYLDRMEIITLTTDAGWFDILKWPKGVKSFADLKSRARRVESGETTVLVAGIDDMIAMKLARGRPQDLADVEELRALERLEREVGENDSDD